MGTAPDLISARFVVHISDRLDPARTRRVVIERARDTITTTAQAREHVTEFLSPAWEIGSVLPIAEPAEFVHVLDALDTIRDQAAAPPQPTIAPVSCPGGHTCECHQEGLD